MAGEPPYNFVTISALKVPSRPLSSQLDALQINSRCASGHAALHWTTALQCPAGLLKLRLECDWVSFCLLT